MSSFLIACPLYLYAHIHIYACRYVQDRVAVNNSIEIDCVINVKRRMIRLHILHDLLKLFVCERTHPICELTGWLVGCLLACLFVCFVLT